MKKSIFATLLILLVGAKFYAKDIVKTVSDPKKQEMMKIWTRYSTPGAPHKILAGVVGKWKYTSKFWEKADAKPEESGGSSTMKMILGDRYLQQETKGKAMGMSFNGMGITGYDNLKEKYESVWLDNMGTGMMHGSGTFDSASQTLKDIGTYSSPATPSKTQDYRSEWKIVDKDNSSYTMWGPGEDGKEFKQMEIIYKRVK